MAGCVEDGMACLPATGAGAEDAGSSSGSPVCMFCVRVNSNYMEEECSQIFEKLTRRR